MMVFENIEAPGFRPPKLLTYINSKAQDLYNYHEELQKIKNMTYEEFLKYKEMNGGFEKYRFIGNENSFRELKNKIPDENPYKLIFKTALKKVN